MKNYASALLFGLLSLTSQLAHADLVDDAIGNIQQAINDAYNPSSASRRDDDDDRYEDRRRNDSRQYDDRRRQLEDRRRQLDDRKRQLDQDRRQLEDDERRLEDNYDGESAAVMRASDVSPPAQTANAQALCFDVGLGILCRDFHNGWTYIFFIPAPWKIRHAPAHDQTGQ